MERDERRRADALDWYWDAVLRGETPARPPHVANEVAVVIAHLGERHVSPRHMRAQERGRARIFARTRNREDAMDTRSFLLPAVAVNTLPAPSWSEVQPVSRPRLWWSAQLATALLLLLTLGLGYLTLRPGRSIPEGLAGVPAIVAMSTPATEPALTTVFASTLPAGEFLAAANLDFVVWRMAIDPGVRVPNQGELQGMQITHVLEGELALRTEGMLQVFRVASVATNAAEVSPGTEVVLHAGDTAVYPFAQSVEYANPGTTPVQIVSGGLFAGQSAWIPDEFTLKDYNEASSKSRLPSGPIEVTLVQATLPPKGEVPAPPAGALVLEVGASGDADVAQRMDGSLRNIGPRETTIYVLTLTPTGAGSGTPTS